MLLLLTHFLGVHYRDKIKAGIVVTWALFIKTIWSSCGGFLIAVTFKPQEWDKYSAICIDIIL